LDWDFGDGGSAGMLNPMPSFPTTNTYAVTLTASSACGQGTIYEKGINIRAELCS
jgi:PKD repeat protein